MSNNISTLRSMEARLLRENKGVLTADAAAQLAKKVKDLGSNTEDVAALKEMFAHDAFAPGVDPNKVLKQAKLPVTVKHDDVAGSSAGTAQVGGRSVQVNVKRTFGPTDGYSNKFQAIAAAKLSGLDPVAVVKDAKGNWHAAELTMPVDKPAGGVLPLKKFDQVALRKAAEDPALAKDPVARLRKLASIELGIPESEINVVNDRSKFESDKINVDVNNTSGGGHTVHQHGLGCGCDGAALEISTNLINGAVSSLPPKPAGSEYTQPAIDASTAVLDRNADAAVLSKVDFLATTLFHEGTHVADSKLMDRAIKQYGKPIPDRDVRTAAAVTERNKFSDWLKNKAKGFTPAEKAQIEKFGVRDVADDPAIEAKAYVSAFVAAYEKNPAAAQGQLDRTGQGTITPKVRQELVDMLKHRYETLPEDKQEAFKAAVRAADKKSGQGFATEIWGK